MQSSLIKLVDLQWTKVERARDRTVGTGKEFVITTVSVFVWGKTSERMVRAFASVCARACVYVWAWACVSMRMSVVVCCVRKKTKCGSVCSACDAQHDFLQKPQILLGATLVLESLDVPSAAVWTETKCSLSALLLMFQALEAHDLTNCVVEFVEEAEVSPTSHRPSTSAQRRLGESRESNVHTRINDGPVSQGKVRLVQNFSSYGPAQG